MLSKRHPLFSLVRRLIALFLLSYCVHAIAHGGVMIEDDQCIVKFGFYKAHFTIYQPQSSQGREFCEDLPDSGPTIFVLNYLHNSLGQVPVDFRIIHNFTDLGTFVKWSDLAQFDSLEPYSVFYQPARVRPEGILMAEHDFDVTGDYIGIISAKHPSTEQVYRAVFPFRVGHGKFFYGLWIVAVSAGFWLLYRFRQHWLRIPGKITGYRASKVE